MYTVLKVRIRYKEILMYSDKEIRRACKRAIKNVCFEGITDVEIFNRPFELKFIEHEITQKNIIDDITKSILSKDIKTSGIKLYGNILVPKKSISDFRKCAWIDIYDEIYYLTLVLLMCSKIEEHRINASKNKVLSYRIIKDFRSKELFNTNYNYTFFKKIVKEQENKRGTNIVVECDISNFYDRLNLHRLESMLLSMDNVDKDTINLLNQLLLYWANRDSYGLPVGSNASRILAEAVLIGVDDFLLSKKINFCRFVDDYRIFAKDSTEAYKNLTLLIERLQIEGLFVNSNKTKVRLARSKRGEIKIEEVEKKLENKNTTNMGVINGYSGLVPLKFREMTLTETEKLKQISLKKELSEIKEKVLIEPSELRELFKIVVAKEEWDLLVECSELLIKFPQLIPYFIDIIMKNKNKINEVIMEDLYSSFGKMLSNETPEYIQIFLVKFFAEGREPQKDILLAYFYKLNRNSGDYVGRAILEALSRKLSRSELLSLRSYFTRADIWEKRQILNLLNEGLPKEEKNAYFKNVSITNQDVMIKHMTNKKTAFLN